MSMPDDPIFQPGDEVVSFRGDFATVTSYRVVDDPGKSNKVTVCWAGESATSPIMEYYAGVFSLR